MRADNGNAPGWFELTEVKLFNADGDNIAPNADSVEILFPSSDDSKVGQINDGKFWFTVWAAWGRRKSRSLLFFGFKNYGGGKH